MEYNLKNFPVKGTPQAYERWGKGLKKELRDEYKLLNSTRHSQNIEGILQKIREILGEDAKTLRKEVKTWKK